MCNIAFAQTDSNAIFESNKGKLPFPLKNSTYPDEFYIQAYKGCFRYTKSETSKEEPYLSFFRKKSEDVFAIFDAKVLIVEQIDSISYFVITKFGDYFISYVFLNKPKCQVGNFIKKGEIIASLSKNENENYSLDLYISKGMKNLDCKEWLFPIK